jgi:hypothetical protein
MKRPDLRFTISHKIRIRVDVVRRRVVIACVTTDGKSLELETDYEAISQIHKELRKQTAGYVPGG